MEHILDPLHLIHLFHPLYCLILCTLLLCIGLRHLYILSIVSSCALCFCVSVYGICTSSLMLHPVHSGSVYRFTASVHPLYCFILCTLLLCIGLRHLYILSNASSCALCFCVSVYGICTSSLLFHPVHSASVYRFTASVHPL